MGRRAGALRDLRTRGEVIPRHCAQHSAFAPHPTPTHPPTHPPIFSRSFSFVFYNDNPASMPRVYPRTYEGTCVGRPPQTLPHSRPIVRPSDLPTTSTLYPEPREQHVYAARRASLPLTSPSPLVPHQHTLGAPQKRWIISPPNAGTRSDAACRLSERSTASFLGLADGQPQTSTGAGCAPRGA